MSKEEILSAIKRNKPSVLPLPDLNFKAVKPVDLLILFRRRACEAKGEVVDVAGTASVKKIIKDKFPKAKRVVGQVGDFATLALDKISDPHQLEPVDLAVLRGAFGVAENGAVWIRENEIDHRVIPFICEHLVLLLSKEDIMADMHEAYQTIQKEDYGYGVFVAGPSKTADIEQSLVVGAHGPKSLTVMLV